MDPDREWNASSKNRSFPPSKPAFHDAETGFSFDPITRLLRNSSVVNTALRATLFQRWTLAVLSLIAMTTTASAQSILSTPPPETSTASLAPPEIQAWPAEIRRTFVSLVDQGGIALMNAIFDGIEKFDVFGSNILANGKLKLGLQYERSVYDNLDLRGTWTVIDRTRIKLDSSPFPNLTTFNGEIATPAVGVPYASLIFSAAGYIDFAQVRQVESQDYRSLPPPESAQVADSTNPVTTPDTDPNVQDLNPFTPWYMFDSSIPARFRKILNPFKLPAILPLSVSTVKRMQIGEVRSYGVEGYVELGLGVGWKLIPDPETHVAGADFSVSAAVGGQFRISVFKESERYVKVKLTRIGELTRKAALTLGYTRKKLFPGFLLFKGSSLELENVLAWNMKVVPFQWESSVKNSKQFDVGYRYDLESKDAREAFHKAVLGSFRDSQEISAIANERPVTEIFSRRSSTETRKNEHKEEFAAIVRYRSTKNSESVEADISLPDGTHQISRSVSGQERLFAAWFGANTERTSRKFTVAIDRELYKENKPTSLFVISESFWDDSFTKPHEIRKITDEIESFLNKPELFPIFPDRVPVPEKPGKLGRVRFGRSSFYYGFHLDLEDIRKLLGLSLDERMRLTDGLFSEDQRRRILDAWERAATADALKLPDPLYWALRDLFQTRKNAFPLMLLVRRAFANEPLDYFVSGQNLMFGRIEEHGKLTTGVDEILALTERELGFEGYADRARADATALVQDLKVEENDDGYLVLKFKLATDANTLHFKLLRTTGLKRFIRMADLLIDNSKTQRFKLGLNEIVLDPQSMDLLTYRLASALNQDDHYTIYVGYTRDGKKYGPASHHRFQPPRSENRYMRTTSITGKND